MPDTDYAEELDRGTVEFEDGSEGRLERLKFKKPPVEGKFGYRFSWWKDDRFMPRPLDCTEDQFVALMRDAIANRVFSESVMGELKAAFS